MDDEFGLNEKSCIFFFFIVYRSLEILRHAGEAGWPARRMGAVECFAGCLKYFCYVGLAYVGMCNLFFGFTYAERERGGGGTREVNDDERR